MLALLENICRIQASHFYKFPLIVSSSVIATFETVKMICSVGLICIDIVNFIPKYPVEDSDQRCAEQTWERGGNASNSATVLALLGTDVEFLGTLANDMLLKFFENEMDSLGIKHNNCPVIDCGNGPTSIVICSNETGSRTIVHAKGNLPELSVKDFIKLNLKNYSWIHFEGRNEHQLADIMKLCQEYNNKNSQDKRVLDDSKNLPRYKKVKLPVSFEVELHIENLENMLPFADVVFVGKDYAQAMGASSCTDAAQMMSAMVHPGTVIVCPWGEHGAAYCVTSSNPFETNIKQQAAYKPATIVDSLGAGDTFNGAVLHCLNKGVDVETSVNYACLLASKKLQIRGIKGLKDLLDSETTDNETVKVVNNFKN